MPPAERYLEVEYLGIVFQPKVRYFVAGRSDSGDTDFKRWTLREVKPDGHGRCGGFSQTADPKRFLESITNAMDLDPDIRLASTEEMQKNAEHIETFPAEFQMASPESILVTAATYKAISLQTGDSSGIPPAAIMQILEKGGQPMQQVVQAILRDAQQEGWR